MKASRGNGKQAKTKNIGSSRESVQGKNAEQVTLVKEEKRNWKVNVAVNVFNVKSPE